jgi:DNA-binding MarR family transcriptional regulator
MRARYIKPGLYKNEHLAECDPLTRLLFTGLWCMADREGRLEDRPKRIKAELLPYDNADVDAMLNDLSAHGFIQRYEVDGGRYIQIVNFTKHQRPHTNEVQSTIPEPPSDTEVSATKESSAANQGDKSGAPREQALDPLNSNFNYDSNSDLDSSSSENASASRTAEKIRPEHTDLAELLAYRIQQNNPDGKPPTPKQLQNWANDVRLMIERDKRPIEQIRELLEWTQQDEFWKANVLSMGKLREKYDQLLIKSRQVAIRGTTNGRGDKNQPDFTTINEFEQFQIENRRSS